MRLRPLLLIAGLAALSATAALANPLPLPGPTCGCHVRHSVAVHARRHARPHVWRQARVRDERYGELDRHTWRGERRWGEERGWSDQHSWSDNGGGAEDEGRWAYGRERDWGYDEGERPSATDRFGFLTWPGKTHFVHGQPVEGDALPPPPPGPPEGMMAPPPPEDWRGPPPEPEDSYDIRRF